MATPAIPKKWTDAKVVPPADKSKQQVAELVILAGQSKNPEAIEAAKNLKKEYAKWLGLPGSSQARAKTGPEVVRLFNKAVDLVTSKGKAAKMGGCGDGGPCGDAGDPIAEIDLEILADKVFQRLMWEARLERERSGWWN